MKNLQFLDQYVHPHKLLGTIVEAPLRDVFVGEICQIRRNWRDVEIISKAQVVGFRGDMAILCLIGNTKGI